MSTNIAIIHGKREVIDKDARYAMIPKYEAQELYITRFMGGKERGTSLQLTLGEGGYIQLDGKTVDTLVMLLKDWRNAPEIKEERIEIREI